MKLISVFSLFLVPSISHAGDVKFYDMTLGEFSCESAISLGEAERNYIASGTSNVTGGKAVKIGANAFGYNWTESVLLVCDADSEKLISVIAQFPKSQAESISIGLERAGLTVGTENLPRIGNGYAEFLGRNGYAEIEYVHLSFSGNLTMATLEYREALTRFQKNASQNQQGNVDGAFD
jgi:hypothetical protein